MRGEERRRTNYRMDVFAIAPKSSELDYVKNQVGDVVAAGLVAHSRHSIQSDV